MNVGKLFGSALFVAGLGALAVSCGDDDGDSSTDAGTTTPTPDMGTPIVDMGTPVDMGTVDMGGGNGFPQPINTIPVNFVVDDTNGSYGVDDGLAWKGSMSYDSTTRITTQDPGWGGPFPTLYDDGPWNEGGHEPAGATAGDGVWGITMFVEIPTDAELAFEFGLIRGSVDGSDGEWIFNRNNWSLNDPNDTSNNGAFVIPVGASEAVDAGSYTIPTWGEVDWRITIDSNAMEQEFQDIFDASMGHEVQVKSSKWGWSLISMVDDGTQGDDAADDGVFTFVLSNFVGDGTNQPHDGLFVSGEEAQFVLQFVIRDLTPEYRPEGGDPHITGITTEFSDDDGATWTATTIGRAGNDNNPATSAP